MAATTSGLDDLPTTALHQGNLYLYPPREQLRTASLFFLLHQGSK
jgi:hypothetical protein